jgi:hypothetical protein
MRLSESIIWRTGQGTKAVIALAGLLSGGAAVYLGGLAYKSFPDSIVVVIAQLGGALFGLAACSLPAGRSAAPAAGLAGYGTRCLKNPQAVGCSHFWIPRPAPNAATRTASRQVEAQLRREGRDAWLTRRCTQIFGATQATTLGDGPCSHSGIRRE